VPFYSIEDLSTHQPDEVVVGCIDHVHQALLKFGVRSQ
jgi:hypothetical protein